jgi:hypothetical protein
VHIGWKRRVRFWRKNELKKMKEFVERRKFKSGEIWGKKCWKMRGILGKKIN